MPWDGGFDPDVYEKRPIGRPGGVGPLPGAPSVGPTPPQAQNPFLPAAQQTNISSSNDHALRDLLRRRMRLPQPQSPGFMTPAAPAIGAGTSPAVLGGDAARAQPNDTRLSPASPYFRDKSLQLNDWSGTGWDQSRELNQIYQLLQQFSDFGSFSPEGNSGFMDAVTGKARGEGMGIRDSNSLLAQSLGTDPATSASYGLQANLAGSGAVARSVNDAVLQRLSSQDELAKSILGLTTQANFGDWGKSRDLDINRQLQDDGGGGIADFLGTVAGGALGGWLSPGGFFRGAR